MADNQMRQVRWQMGKTRRTSLNFHQVHIPISTPTWCLQEILRNQQVQESKSCAVTIKLSLHPDLTHQINSTSFIVTSYQLNSSFMQDFNHFPVSFFNRNLKATTYKTKKSILNKRMDGIYNKVVRRRMAWVWQPAAGEPSKTDSRCVSLRLLHFSPPLSFNFLLPLGGGLLNSSATCLCSRTTLPSSAPERRHTDTSSPSSSSRMLTECRDRSESCRSTEHRDVPHTSASSPNTSACSLLPPSDLHTSLGRMVRLQKGIVSPQTHTHAYRGRGKKNSNTSQVILPWSLSLRHMLQIVLGGKVRFCWRALERSVRRAHSLFWTTSQICNIVYLCVCGGESQLHLRMLNRV